MPSKPGSVELAPSTSVSTSSGPKATPTPSSPVAGGNSTVCLENKANNVVIVVKEDFNYYVHTREEARNFGFNSCAWKASNEGVLQDASVQRYMGVYEDEIKAYGVSRIRGFTSETWPKTALWVSAVHFEYKDQQTKALAFYDASKTTGTDTRAFYPIVCAVKGRGSLLFAAANPDDGIAKLTSPSCQQTITGGQVESCSYVSWSIATITQDTFSAGSW